MVIPTFPKFKNIDLTDRKAIEVYTNKYKPYSDFNFTNLWAWDTTSTRKISQLNGNIVILFTDYRTAKPLISFIGKYKPVTTALQLLEFVRETSTVANVLKFIPKEIAQQLHKSKKLLVEEDTHNFDYIFSTQQIAHSLGSKYKKKRQLAKRFLREHPDAQFILKDFSDTTIHTQLIEILNCWKNNKKTNKKNQDIVHEEKAIKRLMQTSQSHKLVLSCIYIQKNLVGFSIDELINKKYAISHFIKADYSYKGIYEFLNQKVAQYLLKHSTTVWNWEQDLNIEGLRRVKMSYRPITFLKKFKISLNVHD